MDNTYKQAAAKIGKSVGFIKNLVRTGQLEVIDMGHRTKFVTDAAIEDFKRKRTRRAVL